MIEQSTPVLFVDSISPSEAFFAKLGFVRTAVVPETGEPGFVMMHQRGDQDGVGIMLQTRRNAQADLASADPAIFIGHGIHLFMTVADLDAAQAAVGDAVVYLPRRETFYGATEIGYVEPGGHHITLAQFGAA